MKDFTIRFCVEQPDYSDILPISNHNWKYTPYSNPTEDLPPDTPEALEKNYGYQITMMVIYYTTYNI